jgi:hypothetical protein
MIKTISIFFLALVLSNNSYAQKMPEGYKKINDSTYYKIKEDSTKQITNSNDYVQRIRFCILGDFDNDSIKITARGKIIIDTVISTVTEKLVDGEWETEYEEFVYLPEIKLNIPKIKKMEITFQNRKFYFPFKQGYSIIYIYSDSYYSMYYSPILDKELAKKIFFMFYYTNKYLKSL